MSGADFSDADICGELIEDDLACTGMGRTFTDRRARRRADQRGAR